MPLDHVNGEAIEGHGGPYRVAPAGKYQGLPRLTIEADVIVGRKFKTVKRRHVPIFLHAHEYACQCFANAGAAFPLAMDCLAQEYPLTGQVVFLFCAEVMVLKETLAEAEVGKPIVGTRQHLYVAAPYQLSPQQIADLKVAGHWADLTLN